MWQDLQHWIYHASVSEFAFVVVTIALIAVTVYLIRQ